MDDIFAKLQKEHQQEPYLSLDKRKDILYALKKLLQLKAEELAQAVSKDFTHRSVKESLGLEIFPCIQAINYCLKNLKKWTKPRKRSRPWYFIAAKAYIFPQPLGVVGVIVPWNYPLLLSFEPSIYALAAGNRVMIKMSELSPHAGATIKALISSSPLLNSQIAVINGDFDAAKQFLTLPFNHLLFTGSIQVGKRVMEAASKNLTPVTLELGGKSPVIVSSTANPKQLLRVFMGKLFNAGQTCLASDYLLIPQELEQPIEASFTQFLKHRYPNLLTNDDYTAIISSKRREQLESMVEDARQKGGRIVKFGGEQQSATNKMPVYLVFNANKTMQLMQEEIFGPILPIITYQSFSEAITFINSMSNPLALYYFGHDPEEKRVLMTHTLSGAVTINDTMMHLAVDDLPFGGVGNSGMGQYHGQAGFDSFSKLKPVFVQTHFALSSLFYPPYGRAIRLFFKYIAGIKSGKN